MCHDICAQLNGWSCQSCCLGFAFSGLHRSHSSQSLAENRQLQTRAATPGWLRQTSTMHAVIHRHVSWLRSQRRINRRALSEGQRYNHRRSARDRNPVMADCGRHSACRMAYIRDYSRLSMEDCSPLAGEGRKRTRPACGCLVRAQPLKTEDPRDGIKANEFITSFSSKDAPNSDANKDN